MREAWGLLLGLVMGVAGLGSAFWAQGQRDNAGWFWAQEVHAQWQFFDLAWEGEHLVFAITLETRDWMVPPPPFLSATLTFSSFGCAFRTQSVCLQRVAEQGPFVRYFGQVVLSRRDVGFGSYLVVSLRARAEAKIGVHGQTLGLVRMPVAWAGGAGSGGPFVPVNPGGAGESVSLSGKNLPPLGIRECHGREDAPYLAPGTYQGELGWPGPGHALDSSDWFRVNLAPGQLLELRLSTPYPVSLRVLSPSGQEVGRVAGQGRLGLVYEARERGAYHVCVSLVESTPLFSYTVELLLRR